MKKRRAKLAHRQGAKRSRQSQNYLVIIRGWMLVVALAIMLGVGAIVGRFFNEKLNEATPTVAGVEVEAK